jgi:serine/threonine protein kinase
MENEKLKSAKFFILSRDLVKALMFFNDVGYFHGDIKPSNIIVGKNNLVLIDPLILEILANLSLKELITYP